MFIQRRGAHSWNSFITELVTLPVEVTKLMFDYRGKCKDYQHAWCIKHQQVIIINSKTKLMNAAYHLPEDALYPYAIYDDSCEVAATPSSFEPTFPEQITIG